MSDKPRSRSADDQVSEHTTARLSLYLRTLDVLEAASLRTVSSTGLAERLQLNPAQIRKDLAHFGELGVRGVGYGVSQLRSHLRTVLGLDRQSSLVIVGAGNLGLALADYAGFRDGGFRIVALFDVAAEKIGSRSRSGVPVRALDELASVVRSERVEIALITVPARAAQTVADQVVASGVRAVLNFSPAAIRVPTHVKVKSADVSILLESLSYFLTQEPHAPAT